MKLLIRYTTIALVISFAVPAFSQSKMDLVNRRHDKNGDGKVTREEFTGPAPVFARLDTDKDGTITAKDFDGMRGRGGKGRSEASWKMSPVRGPNLHYKIFESSEVGEEVSYAIYLPPGYESDSIKRYPVVYWLHGLGGSQQGVPKICENMTSQIEAGKLEPFIVVFANGMIASMYCDAVNADVPVESMIINDLIPHVDKTYRTKTERKYRMIEGFSMGGFGSARLGFKYPELFGSISILDGALAELDSFSRRHPDIYEQVFDSNPDNYNRAHPFTLLDQNKEKIKGNTLIRVAVGKLVPYNQALKKELDEAGVVHEYDELNVPHSPNPVYEALGNRNWDFYNRAFR